MLTRMTTALAGMCLMVGLAGCWSHSGAPRPRMGTIPTPPPGPRFLDPNNMGRHSYGYNPFEKNGIVYACQAGHIDVTHIRWVADYTRYCTERTYKTLMKDKNEFSFKLALEVSVHKAKFTYPDNWGDLSKEDKERIAHEVAFAAGPYLAFGSTTWHEILTWFNVHFAIIEPEFNSSFSWEDMYSNVLGARLAVEAMRNDEYDYDTAMTLAIERELHELGLRSKKTALYAAEKMRGQWYTGRIFVDTIKKNMDIGLDDGYVTPVLVPGICEGAEAKPYPVPTLDVLSEHGFELEYTIRPREWERREFLKVIYPDGKDKIVHPEEHFAVYMDYIRKQAVEKYDYIVD